MHNFPSNVLCDTSKAQDGNMDFRFSETEEVIRNRSHFLQKYGVLYEDHIAMRCDHGDIISLVTSFNPEPGAKSQEDQIHSEVLVTQERNLVLMLFTADCQPTSFYDPITHTIALAHISRATLCNGLTQKTVHFLQESFGVEPQNLLVTIGPSIHKENYAFPLPLEETYPMLEGFIEERDGYAYIDLTGAHQKQLEAMGIEPVHIYVSPDDTSSPEYFSYHKMKTEGDQAEARMATILMMQ